MTAPVNACSCAECRTACTRKPGWFLPGEADSLAEAMGITLLELFETKLAVDWWEGGFDDPDTFVLSPAVIGNPPGEEFPGDPYGRCVFYADDGRCEIHVLGKPHECAALSHDQPNIEGRHRAVAEAWKPHQDQIHTLLNRDPVSSDYDATPFSRFGWFR